jgi:hypothetical protein
MVRQPFVRWVHGTVGIRRRAQTERGGTVRPGTSPATGKPKKRTGADLKRLANLRQNPFAALVVDPYYEDRTRIGWLTLQDRAEILDLGQAADTVSFMPRLCSTLRTVS